jgi:hypothetical protein
MILGIDRSEEVQRGSQDAHQHQQERRPRDTPQIADYCRSRDGRGEELQID